MIISGYCNNWEKGRNFIDISDREMKKLHFLEEDRNFNLTLNHIAQFPISYIIL